jgi:hypothetical protein
MARNTEFLAINPSYYGTQHAGFDFFTLHGAPGTYNKATGGIAGLMWKQSVKKGKPFFAVSTSYVAPSANLANATQINTSSTTGSGILSAQSGGSWLTQVGFQAKQWKTTFAWRYGQCGQVFARRGTNAAGNNSNNYFGCDSGSGVNGGDVTTTATSGGIYSNSFAYNLAWQPKKSGTVVPSLSLGWGYNAFSQGSASAPQTFNSTINSSGISNQLTNANIAATQSWTVALQWDDAFSKGNAAGLAVGQGTFVTATRNGVTPQDGNYVWEWWYKFRMSDNIAITPIMFYMSNPSSAGTAIPTAQNSALGAGVWGALMTTTFKF